MRVVVTGANGLLGSALLPRLSSAGYKVLAIDRSPAMGALPPSVEFRTIDLGDYQALREAVAGTAALIHLAALTHPEVIPEPGVHHNNVIASYNALSAAGVSGVGRVCLASSVNAIGGIYSREPRFDYFPVDEKHPSYAEDPYSLSKWIAEQQASALARRHRGLSVACLRFHALRERAEMAERLRDFPEQAQKDLWGYTPPPMAVDACLASLTVDIEGSETFYVVAEDTYLDVDSEDLRRRHYPWVPVRGDLAGRRSFFDSSKGAVLQSSLHQAMSKHHDTEAPQS